MEIGHPNTLCVIQQSSIKLDPSKAYGVVFCASNIVPHKQKYHYMYVAWENFHCICPEILKFKIIKTYD